MLELPAGDEGWMWPDHMNPPTILFFSLSWPVSSLPLERVQCLIVVNPLVFCLWRWFYSWANSKHVTWETSPVLIMFCYFAFSNLKCTNVMNENEIMASLISPFPSLLLLGRKGPRGAPTIPTWGEQYPKIILVCFPKALVNRWFLKSPGFLPAWTCVNVILP